MASTISIPNIIIAAIIAVMALLVAGALNTGMRLMIERGRIPASFEKPIFNIVRWGSLILALMLILSVFSVNLSVIWGALAVGFGLLAIGFIAGWSMLSNLSATVLIHLTRPFNIGDRVEFMGEQTRGEVQAIGPMFTTLLDEEGHLIQIPNNAFFQKVMRRRKRREIPAPIPERDHL